MLVTVIVCDLGPPSVQFRKTYRSPNPLYTYGEAVRVYEFPGFHSFSIGVVMEFPSSWTNPGPAGLDVTTDSGGGVKLPLKASES